MKTELKEIIKNNSTINYDRFTDTENRVITDENILDMVNQIELLFYKEVVELRTKIDVYETFIDKSNFRAFTKKGK